jgi:2-polyprenyl-3-methyl-5-hydroxy-6-metoxy-1,4-benzoquinol methylase
MTVIRLRANYSDEELQRLYSPLYEPEKFQDHRLRLPTTSTLLSWAIDRHGLSTIADLACGNGAVVITALKNCAHKPQTVHLGDLSKENIDHVTTLKKYGQYGMGTKVIIKQGKVENTIDSIEKVDIFVMSEILEHVDQPSELLKKVREKTRYLLLSTPSTEDNGSRDFNIEHLWSWNRTDILEMLLGAGFEPQIEEKLSFKEEGFPYDFQIWLAY